MRKLWKKILKSPLNSTGLDSKCRAAFDEFGMMPGSDTKSTETDFFDLERIKPEVLKLYERSVCREVYESSSSDQDATRVALAEGVVSLLVKVYCLEVCLAAVIAWDSFDIANLFEENALSNIIITNIRKDIPDGFESIIFFANNIIKKQEKTTDLESYLAPILSRRSSLEALIKREGTDIAKQIRSLFKNDNSLSTGKMTFDILKNSDVDFSSEAALRMGISNVSGSPHAQNLAALYSEGGFEYVADVKIKNNIYTMNYGMSPGGGPSNLYGLNFNNIADLTSLGVDLYGFESTRHIRPEGQIYFQTQKERPHSMPLRSWPSEVAQQETENFQTAGSYNQNIKDYASTVKKYNKFTEEMPLNQLGPEKNSLPVIDFKFKHTSQVAAGLHSDISRGSENNYEALHGDHLNAKLGNITIEPYIRIVDATAEDRKDKIAKIYSNIGPDGEPCEEPILQQICDAYELLGDAPFMGEYRQGTGHAHKEFSKLKLVDPTGTGPEGNLFNAHIFGYVPLQVWSHFYSNVFLPYINEHETNGYKCYKTLFENFGLGVFFKEISFGIRLSYSTSYPITDAPDMRFNEFMSNAMIYAGHGINSSKSLFNCRPYVLDSQISQDLEAATGESVSRTILNEIRIPIAEVERPLELKDDGFVWHSRSTVTTPYSELGHYSGWFNPGSSFIPTLTVGGIFGEDAEAITEQSPHSAEFIEHYKQYSGQVNDVIKNSQQFFYKNIAQDLLNDLQETPEFKLMYEHLFPMRKYMLLSFLYAADGLSKFIPEPTDVLDETKLRVRQALDAVLSSGDYKFIPEEVQNQLSDMLVSMDLGTTGKEPNLTKQVLKILFMTPLIVLKSFVEITDPAVMIAKSIIDIANAIQQSIIAAIEQGIQAAKQATEAALNQAKSAQMQIEFQASFAGSALEGTADGIKNSLPEDKKSKINIMVTDLEIESWQLDASPLSQAEIEETGWPEDQIAKYNKFANEDLPNVKELRDKYVTLKGKVQELETKKAEIEKELVEKVGKAKKEAAKLFASPFLLPGMWAALLPSLLPFGGGLVPPPFPGGPPSTVPGMIYIALLLIDVYEEKLHEESEAMKKGVDCENEL